MLHSDKQIFIHLPKTGGSSLRPFLRKNLRWSELEMPVAYKAWWHRPYSMCPKSIALKKEPVVFIRNPWDFYVSFWAYDSKAFKTHPTNVFRELYGSEARFDVFLENMLLGDSNTRFSLPQKVEIPLVQILKDYDIGLLTFFYLYMTLENTTPLNSGKLDLDSANPKVKTYKLENLNKEFEKIFKVSGTLGKSFRALARKNVSAERDQYRSYYDDDLEGLILHKERYLINKFNYKF